MSSRFPFPSNFRRTCTLIYKYISNLTLPNFNKQTRSPKQEKTKIPTLNQFVRFFITLYIYSSLTTPSFGGSLTRVCAEHINPQIRSEANNLLYTWLAYLYATGGIPKRSLRDDVRDRRDDKDHASKSGADDFD